MKVKITLKRSLIGEKPKARETARSLGLKIKSAVFDRGGYVYHGRIKSLADGIREKGIKF